MSKKNSKKKTKQGVKKTEKIQEKNETKRQESLDTKKRNVTNNEYEENQKESKKKMIIQYMIPLALLIVVALIYIQTQKNILLIPFAVLTMIVLFGWDASTRTCPECRKWNSVSWLKTENIKRTTTKSKKNLLGKEKTEKKTVHIRKIYKKCRNCGHEFETEQTKLF